MILLLLSYSVPLAIGEEKPAADSGSALGREKPEAKAADPPSEPTKAADPPSEPAKAADVAKDVVKPSEAPPLVVDLQPRDASAGGRLHAGG